MRLKQLAIWAILLPAAVLAEAPSAKPAIHGSLTTEQGVRVLRVWGTPREQGYAHGYLLGENLRQFLGDLLLDSGLIPNPSVYETAVRPQVIATFELTAERRAELEGILAGVTDRCGVERCRFESLDRPIEVNDLLALNTIADWAPGACSSFAVWGGWTEGGETIVGRNLDYLKLPGIDAEHLIIARLEAGDGRKPWVSIAWPGLIGAYSAISQSGTVVAMHDAPSAKAYGKSGLMPRSFALREIVEKAAGAATIETAEKILADTPTFRGNNFLVAGPSSIGDAPAAVFEYDGDSGQSGYVTRRNPGDSVNHSPADTICCTNHYRARGELQQCWRYQVISKSLTDWPGETRFNVSAAWDLLGKAAVDSTLHSFVARCDAGEIWVSFCDKSANACQNKPVKFKVDSLLRRPDDTDQRLGRKPGVHP